VPWFMGSTISTGLLGVLHDTPWDTIGWVYFFGVLWGFGGLTFGLTMRYLGMSLGMAMVLGYCAAFGTLVPPIYHGTFFSNVLPTLSGQVIVLGIAICMAGIVFAGKAGMSKEKEMTVEQKTAVIGEFNLKKGVIVATFSGVMSACFSFGLDAGAPIKALALQHGTSTLWQGLPVLVVLLAGGFTTNFIWCVILNVKNHTGYQYFSAEIRNHHPARGEERILENAIDAPSEEVVEAMPARSAAPDRAPMLNNYFFAALAGTIWYFQFFFYTMGETQMGKYKFSSWTLHMASIIIFSSLWGIALHEWRGASRRTKTWLAVSLLTLVGSTIVVGYGNYLGTLPVR